MNQKQDTAEPASAQVKLRLPLTLRQQIKARAALNVRTLNSEILHLLQNAMKPKEPAQ